MAAFSFVLFLRIAVVCNRFFRLRIRFEQINEQYLSQQNGNGTDGDSKHDRIASVGTESSETETENCDDD